MKKFFLNLSLVFISISLSFLVIEFGVRAWYKSNNLFSVDLQYNLDTKPMLYRGETDYLFKSDSFLASKNKVLFIGDSFTFGDGLPYEDTFPIQIQKLLDKEKRKITSINAGLGGQNFVDHYVILKDQLKRYTPDLVVLTLNSNDHNFSPWNLSPSEVCPNIKMNTASYMIKHSYLFHYLYHQLDRYKSIHDPETIDNDPRVVCSKIYLKKITNLLHEKKIPLIIAYHHGTLKQRKLCQNFSNTKDKIIEDVTRIYDIKPIFLTPEVVSDDCQKSESYYNGDDYHLTKEGYFLFAKKLIPLIKKKLNLN